MKKLILSTLLICSTLSLTGCGFNWGCDGLCSGSGSYVFNVEPQSCCRSLPW